jgi:hypothetical protein
MTLPTQECDSLPDITSGNGTAPRGSQVRPGMLSVAGVRRMVIGLVTAATALSLALVLLGAGSHHDSAGSGSDTHWLSPEIAGQLTSLGSGQWLLQGEGGACVVNTQVNGGGALQVVPVDPSSPGCVGVPGTAR